MKLMRFKTARNISRQYGLVEGDKVYPLKNSTSVAEAFIAASGKKLSAGKGVQLSSLTPLPPSGECAHMELGVITVRIASKDGVVDLGEQRNPVIGAPP